MTPTPFSRRDFLKVAASAGGVAWLSVHWPAVLAAAKEAGAARDAKSAFKVLAADEAGDFAAIAAQIFPTDELPGATEAGVVYFIDNALATFMAAGADGLRGGLKALNAKAGGRFSQLSGDKQVTLLKSEETSPFFRGVLFLTVAGMFSLPSQGGNRNEAGWKVLGFDSRHVWQPPFGHYDAGLKS